MSPDNYSMIYSGTFDRVLDAKKRVTVPACWLQGEEDVFHCVLDPRGEFLNVLPPQEFAKVEQKLIEGGWNPRQRKEFMRRFYGGSHLLKADKQGRLLFPETFCVAANLKDQIILVGTGTQFEVWSPDRWTQFHAKGEEDFRKIADDIGL